MATGARAAARATGCTLERRADQATISAAAATAGQNSTPLRMTIMSEILPMARGSSSASVLRRPTTNPTNPGTNRTSSALTIESNVSGGCTRQANDDAAQATMTLMRRP